jgi:putative flippase GtrA
MRKAIEDLRRAQRRAITISAIFKLAKTFLRFGAVGIFVTGLNFFIFYLFILNGANYFVAAIGSWLPSMLIAFFLNRQKTFKVKTPARFSELLDYGKANILQLGLSLIVFAILVDGLSVSLLAASLCNLVVLPVFNFLVLRFFVFPEVQQGTR